MRRSERISSTLLVVLVATMGGGCASAARQVQGSVNAYEFHNARHCARYPDCTAPRHCEHYPDAADCAARVALLRRWDRALSEAKAALVRGGPMVLQLAALKALAKEASK